MGMSDHERALLVTGTLDTSGVGGSPYASLDRVAVAFGAEVHEGDFVPQEAAVAVSEVVSEPEPEEKVAENGPSEPVVEPEVVKEPEAEKPAPRKRASAKKVQASAPADE